MFNYIKNRYKFFIPLFLLGFIIGFYAASSGQDAPVFLVSILSGIGSTFIIGNIFYYIYSEKMSAYGAYFRSFKNIAFVVVLFIVTLTFYRIITGN